MPRAAIQAQMTGTSWHLGRQETAVQGVSPAEFVYVGRVSYNDALTGGSLHAKLLKCPEIAPYEVIKWMT